MEHTSSLTADRDTSEGSRFTVSLVRPICSRKDTPWKDSREWVGLGALVLPLDRRPYSVAEGLVESEAECASGAAGCAGTGNGLGKDGGDVLPKEDICTLSPCFSTLITSGNVQHVSGPAFTVDNNSF